MVSSSSPPQRLPADPEPVQGGDPGARSNPDQAEQQVLGIDAAVAESAGFLPGHEDSRGGVLTEPGQHPAVDGYAGAPTGAPGRAMQRYRHLILLGSGRAAS